MSNRVFDMYDANSIDKRHFQLKQKYPYSKKLLEVQMVSNNECTAWTLLSCKDFTLLLHKHSVISQRPDQVTLLLCNCYSVTLWVQVIVRLCVTLSAAPSLLGFMPPTEMNTTCAGNFLYCHKNLSYGYRDSQKEAGIELKHQRHHIKYPWWLLTVDRTSVHGLCYSLHLRRNPYITCFV